MIPRRPLKKKLLPKLAAEAEDFDECHWILAEVAASAWEHAGNDRSSSTRDRVGVYIGHSGGSRRPGDLIYGTLRNRRRIYFAIYPN